MRITNNQKYPVVRSAMLKTIASDSYRPIILRHLSHCQLVPAVNDAFYMQPCGDGGNRAGDSVHYWPIVVMV